MLISFIIRISIRCILCNVRISKSYLTSKLIIFLYIYNPYITLTSNIKWITILFHSVPIL